METVENTVQQVLISRTRIDKPVWDKLRSMSEYQNRSREDLINLVLGNFVRSYEFKLQKKTEV